MGVRVSQRNAFEKYILIPENLDIASLQETEDRLQVKSSELKALGALHLFGQQDGEHPGDQAFSKQVNSAIQDCQALSQQVSS